MKCGKCSFENPPNSQFCSRCGSRFDVPTAAYATTITVHAFQAELPVGSTFAGRYQVIEELGKGGMGRVYKVLDKEINERIALKLLKPEISADEKTIERFRNELKLARKITHENVCRMYDLNNHEGVYFITMEYVSGEDLKGTIARLGQLSEGKILFIAGQVCKGLSAAHRLGVIHRDLKPHNIMIDRQGDVRIMDFGIARSISSSGITESGVMIGTPEYMSPEQAMGEEVDQRSDIYSLGIILFELATGTVPFKGDTAVSVALKQKTELPPSPRKLCPQISEDLSRLILKCIEKNKERRYRNVEEVLDELANIRRGLPTTDRVVPEGVTADTLVQTGRRPFLKTVVPVLAILLILSSAFVVYKLLTKNGKTAMGVLSVKSVPENAEIYIDDKPESEGITPKEINLSPGTHKLKLTLDRYKDFEEEITIEAGKTITPSAFQLELLETLQMGTLQIKSVPDGAEIFIDDGPEPVGTTPKELPLATGSHKVRLKHPDYPEKTDEVTIDPDKTSPIEYVLAPYVLNVTSVPSKAKISIYTRDSNRYVGTTPQYNILLTENEKSVRIRVDNGRGLSAERSVTLEPGVPKSEHFKLEKKTFLLKVNIDPPDAMVFLEGEPVKELPLEKSLPSDTYLVRVEKAGYKSEELKIQLNSDRTETISLVKLEEVRLIVNANSPSIVYVDGREIGEVPFPKEISVTVGMHSIEFESKAFKKKKEAKIEARAGLTLEVKYYVNRDEIETNYLNK